MQTLIDLRGCLVLGRDAVQVQGEDRRIELAGILGQIKHVGHEEGLAEVRLLRARLGLHHE